MKWELDDFLMLCRKSALKYTIQTSCTGSYRNLIRNTKPHNPHTITLKYQQIIDTVCLASAIGFINIPH